MNFQVNPLRVIGTREAVNKCTIKLLTLKLSVVKVSYLL